MPRYKKYGIHVGEKAYYAPDLGDAWRTHRFLILSDETTASIDEKLAGQLFHAEQELHYIRHPASALLKAAIFAPVRKTDSIKVLGQVTAGSEHVVRGLWNRALHVGVALNWMNLEFDDYRTVENPAQAKNCDAGLKASFDVMGHGFDFGRHGNFNTSLLNFVRDKVALSARRQSVLSQREETKRLFRELRASR